jgi:hypothetical protein
VHSLCTALGISIRSRTSSAWKSSSPDVTRRTRRPPAPRTHRRVRLGTPDSRCGSGCLPRSSGLRLNAFGVEPAAPNPHAGRPSTVRHDVDPRSRFADGPVHPSHSYMPVRRFATVSRATEWVGSARAPVGTFAVGVVGLVWGLDAARSPSGRTVVRVWTAPVRRHTRRGCRSCESTPRCGAYTHVDRSDRSLLRRFRARVALAVGLPRRLASASESRSAGRWTTARPSRLDQSRSQALSAPRGEPAPPRACASPAVARAIPGWRGDRLAQTGDRVADSSVEHLQAHL